LHTDQFFQFVQDHLHEDPALLLLKYHQSVDFDLKEAVQQVACRQKAAVKLPEWVSNPKVLFPASLSLEQSSSELTARFKAKDIQGEKLIDLTGGLGVDTFYLGQHFDHVLYLERQEKLAELAAHNFSLLDASSNRHQIKVGDSISFLESTEEVFDWLYVDPARRDENNKKLYRLADCEPDVKLHWDLLKSKSRNIMIKASPMLDIKAVLAELPDIQEVRIVALKNEVKEVMLLWHHNKETDTVKIGAFDLKGKEVDLFHFTYKDEEMAVAAYSMPETYLIEPNAAIMKAGAFKSFALAYGFSKLHPNTHLYTTSQLPAEIPGRIFKIIKEVKLDKKTIKSSFPGGKANVIVRNHPLKADVLKKKYGLKDGGNDFLLATTPIDDKARVYWCERINP